jgi:hypothetical protein
MSKLSKMLLAEYTHDRKAVTDLNMDYTKVDYVYERTTPVIHDYSVKISAGINAFGYVRGSEKSENLQHHYVIKNMKKSIIEEMFGEFRPIIMDIRRSLFERDCYKAEMLLDKLQEQMFEVE